MKLIVVMVMSLDGKTTNGEETRIHHWTSAEDKQLFSSLLQQSQALAMGRKTFLAVKSLLVKLPETSRCYVLTSQPEDYAQQTSDPRFIFTAAKPQELVASLNAAGHTEALLIGGQETNAAFLKAGLVTELWVTIEPVLFGVGKSLGGDQACHVELELFSSERLNPKGTLLLKYLVKGTLKT